MRILWLFAHPEPKSLNAALRDAGRKALADLGHELRESDLYAMGWNPVVSAADFGGSADRLAVSRDSAAAYASGALAADIQEEQDKLRWADAVVVQFPLWWFGPPAILKGWFDRVLVEGFAYGVPGADGRPLRYGAGPLSGKRAFTIVSTGSAAPGFTPRGVHGALRDVLWPLLHGVFFYTGMDVLAPLEISAANRTTPEDADRHAARLRDRLAGLADEAPIPFRAERADYEGLLLRPDVAPGRTGLDAHLR
ncbi:NAD(P)H-dependent oxidoreductase [Actinomadura rayongensis]|uniref:Flavodoxin family protein n=1 Tax=Actinomadura rayongensis TaxID=1429076 RepID=A0A6I4W789_9ACTN|nr:NAD(P)H-dependent oxidoreductase [Actinomadura rayongensis]MXQ65153.1 flavodoxin family protein [Actinomadura rayongensis]